MSQCNAREILSVSLGKARSHMSALPSFFPLCAVLSYFRNPPNSGMYTGSLTCVRGHSYACVYTRGLGTPTTSQHNILTRKNAQKLFLCTWRGSKSGLSISSRCSTKMFLNYWATSAPPGVESGDWLRSISLQYKKFLKYILIPSPILSETLALPRQRYLHDRTYQFHMQNVIAFLELRCVNTIGYLYHSWCQNCCFTCTFPWKLL